MIGEDAVPCTRWRQAPVFTPRRWLQSCSGMEHQQVREGEGQLADHCVGMADLVEAAAILHSAYDASGLVEISVVNKLLFVYCLL